MQTLAQIRNDVLKKISKKRKLGYSSLRSPDLRLVKHIDKKIKFETKKEKFKKNENHKGILINNERCQNDLSLCSSSKRKKENEGFGTTSLKRRRQQKKKKTRKDEVVPDETTQLKRRVKNLLLRIKLEQNFIDAYLGEGWKGQSREKIKPEKELEKAKNQILKCKLRIRDTIQQLDSVSSVGQIDHSLIDPDGSVHHEHIICKKCKSQAISEDNDIILCDGTCNCGFHQKCIDPPLATKDIPPEDEGWLCKYCNCKMEILDAMNAHLGTQFSAYCTWQDIFKEEAQMSNGGTSDRKPEEEWPDDESDDDDYDPKRDENDLSNRFSMEGSDLHEETSTSTSTSCCSLESEVLSESGGRRGVSSFGSLMDRNCVPEFDDNEITSGPRKRCAVDYRKLYDEMFGKDTNTSDTHSEDEDWDPSRRRQREKERIVANTLMTLCESQVKPSNPQTNGVGNNNPSHQKDRKPLSRIPIDVVQKLRQAFLENELPSRDVKRKISDELGLEYKKVNRWFKNARYMSLKNKKKERDFKDSTKESNSAIDKESEVTVPKCSSMPISTHKNKRLQKVSWKTNLATLISPSQRHKLKKTSLGNPKVNVEPSDDMNLKKHLVYLKTRIRHSKKVEQNTEQLQQLNAEKQMEHLCSIQEKLWKLKQVLSTIKEVKSDKTDSQKSTQKVVYVPFAELKEKL